MQSLECIFTCQVWLDAPIRVELCCFVLSKVCMWWCLLSALFTQHMIVCCLPSYCLPRALKDNLTKQQKEIENLPSISLFSPLVNQPSWNIRFWPVYLEWTENLNLEGAMYLLNFTYSSLALECRVLSKFLGEIWEYFCEHLLVLNQIWYCYFLLYIPISLALVFSQKAINN